MKYILITPKNPNLKHCSDSFYEALELIIDHKYSSTEHLDNFSLAKILYLIKNINTLEKGTSVSIFLFSLQVEYLIIAIFFKMISKILSLEFKIHYLMHEPRYKKQEVRISYAKVYFIYLYNLLMCRLSDKILIPSDQAFIRAKTFVDFNKINRINLGFTSVPKQVLQNNLLQLKSVWQTNRVFSMIGTVTKDKNPQGFSDFASITSSLYQGKASFIRAGKNKNTDHCYDEELIIKFPSYISTKSKSFLLNLTHFMVIPYFFSTQSGVIAESLSYGKLLIVNNIPAFDYLRNLNFVFLIDFNSKDSIVECVHSIFSMNITDYEKRYWEALDYFQENHSEQYISKVLKNII